ncbi:cobyric acid synthase [Metallumcola ferriviriculae]|uniref:Cobyric acid synthase n=1 Tax=Metallumcola ferriviriculae TaxID=3039180 RepID=A0AAU0UNB1_9FIRM|nr:cobyric acid synthase [Desulfitibacteraceae bacterium MK1]
MAKKIMLQGTSSNVGKSVLAAALCRIFAQDGYGVVPFKAQNMALNSYVTQDGGEMGRAQVVQAEAAGIDPDIRMNPILLKPTGDAKSQVVLLGKPIRNMSAQEYHLDFNTTALGVIQECLDYIDGFQVAVIEGAGSPAEVNLKARDIVNMRVAKMSGAPVLLVADIDRGGALASVVGTLELLDEDERDLVKGIIINKFRGDIKLLQPALDFLEAKTGKPILGVVPYFTGFKIPEEDSVVLEQGGGTDTEDVEKVNVKVIHLPRISNFTDIDSLEAEPDVSLTFVQEPGQLKGADLIIIPGSKNTIEDALYLEKSGLAEKIRRMAAEGCLVIGICGGFQILGRELRDPQGTEASVHFTKGLGLLDLVTIFEPQKVTNQARARCLGKGFLFEPFCGKEFFGYEIHMGRTVLGPETDAAFVITQRSGQKTKEVDGAVNKSGKVFGTYLHGLFDNDEWRMFLLNTLRAGKGLEHLGPGNTSTFAKRQQDYDKLAQVVRGSLDMDLLKGIMGF